MTDDIDYFCAVEGNGAALDHYRELADESESHRLQREAREQLIELLDTLDTGEFDQFRAIEKVRRVGRELIDAMGW